ncbi:hypothetical protein LWI29_021667 [Acer saccharum]|uniref:TF-B3 domain-containing protein n=1 Tax=Acer saccharum TaxID=4024 RepID=A0AA39W4G0_ACESA|nr:hypothetical protein LWI29_021667 [Acer saccharum]
MIYFSDEFYLRAFGYIEALGHDGSDSSHFGLTLHLMLANVAAAINGCKFPRSDAGFVLEDLKALSTEVQVSKCYAIPRAGRKWKLRYYTRPNGRRRSPVFTAGWRRFVKAKRLRVGDKFTFYGNQVRAADGQLKMRYMIEVKRPSMLTFNGEPVTLDVEYLA